MIVMTPVAIEKAKTALAAKKDAMALRISILGDGCSGFHYQMTLVGEPEADDEILDMDGLKVLIDSRSMLYLNGTVVDYIEGPEGSGFTFDNPNEISCCGYGDVFDA